MRTLTAQQLADIDHIAALPPTVGQHAAFMRCVLGEKSYFDLVFMSRAVVSVPLDAKTMRYIAERW